jgi:hypothetical protein
MGYKGKISSRRKKKQYTLSPGVQEIGKKVREEEQICFVNHLKDPHLRIQFHVKRTTTTKIFFGKRVLFQQCLTPVFQPQEKALQVVFLRMCFQKVYISM